MEIKTHQLVLTTADVGDIHIVSGRREIFKLLASEDVEGDQMDLGVAVLASLGSGHVDNLAGTVLDNNEAVLAQSRALHGVGQRRASIGGIESDIVLEKTKKARSVNLIEFLIGSVFSFFSFFLSFSHSFILCFLFSPFHLFSLSLFHFFLHCQFTQKFPAIATQDTDRASSRMRPQL